MVWISLDWLCIAGLHLGWGFMRFRALAIVRAKFNFLCDFYRNARNCNLYFCVSAEASRPTFCLWFEACFVARLAGFCAEFTEFALSNLWIVLNFLRNDDSGSALNTNLIGVTSERCSEYLGHCGQGSRLSAKSIDSWKELIARWYHVDVTRLESVSSKALVWQMECCWYGVWGRISLGV